MPLVQTFANASARGWGEFLPATDDGSSYDLISTTLLSSSVASVTFDTSALSAYKHLQIRMTARTSRASTQDDIILRFNSSSSSYLTHYLEGNGSSLASSSYNFTGVYAASAGAASLSSGEFGPSVVDILDFGSSNKNKTTRSFFGQSKSTSPWIYFTSTGWFSTSAITSIQILSLNSANLVSGSRFSLYGLKG